MEDPRGPSPVCVETDGDLDVLKLMLENHGIAAYITPPGRSVDAGLWVDVWDASRAKDLITNMHEVAQNPVFGFWPCGCGERVEGQFDTCWQCGRAHE